MSLLSYDYTDALDASIGRVSAISEALAGTLESYSYLGLGTVFGLSRTLVSAADKTLSLSYADVPADEGLDAFGRVARQRWTLSGGGSSGDLEKLYFAYDASGNLLSRENQVRTAMSELYSADNVAANASRRGTFLTAFCRRSSSAVLCAHSGGATGNLLLPRPARRLGVRASCTGLPWQRRRRCGMLRGASSPCGRGSGCWPAPSTTRPGRWCGILALACSRVIF